MAGFLGRLVPVRRVPLPLVVARASSVRGSPHRVSPSPERATEVPDGSQAFDVSARGRTTFDAVYGGRAERVRESLLDLHPDLAEWTEGFAYGVVLARGDLTLVERELLAVSILTALGGLDDPLLGHMRAAV